MISKIICILRGACMRFREEISGIYLYREGLCNVLC